MAPWLGAWRGREGGWSERPLSKPGRAWPLGQLLAKVERERHAGPGRGHDGGKPFPEPGSFTAYLQEKNRANEKLGQLLARRGDGPPQRHKAALRQMTQ
jgi:hypothetical protein